MVVTRRGNGSASYSSAITPRKLPSDYSPPDEDDKSAENREQTTTMPPPTSVFIPPPTHSPYLPTRTEVLLIAIFPLTLFLGSLFSWLSPTFYPPFTESVYSHTHQSFQPASSAPSYFAQKRNVFNVYFVKIGWFWCTVSFFIFLFFIGRGRSTPPKIRKNRTDAADETQTNTEVWRNKRDEKDQRVRRRYQALLRYAMCTLAWIGTTQWFFGPPLVDRGFAFTGGVCERAEKDLEQHDQGKIIGAALTHAACKAAGGMWKGGYDISGHVFILVLSSGMLWMEMLPFLLPRVKGLSVGRVIRSVRGEIVRVANEIGDFELYVKEKERPTGSAADMRAKAKWSIKAYATTMTLAVGVLSWWMLLMTAAFFHTWFEKATGLLLAFATLWAVYFLPRGVPSFRSFIGMPGV